MFETLKSFFSSKAKSHKTDTILDIQITKEQKHIVIETSVEPELKNEIETSKEKNTSKEVEYSLFNFHRLEIIDDVLLKANETLQIISFSEED